MFKYKKVLLFANRLIYLMSVAMLIAGAVFTVTPQLASAGSGRIWTTSSACGTPQDANHYTVGEPIYIHGAGFDPSTTYSWAIIGQPGSSDPGITVASGSEATDVNGDVCFYAYTIQPGDDGVYKFGYDGKNDNYSVNGVVYTYSLDITKTILGTSVYTIGGDINYLITVTNTGTGALTGVTIDDSGGTGLSCTWPGTAGELAAGASVSCTTYHRVVQADYDNGSFTNTASTDSNETGPDTASATAYFTQTVDLSLVKSALPTTYGASQSIAYSYVLTNDGNVTLIAPFTVNDDKVTVTCPASPTSLAPGGSITCSASYTTTQADVDAGSITNIATGHGYFGTTQVDSNQDTVTITAISSTAIGLDKTATPSTYSAVGQVISYSYRITNTGTLTVSGAVAVNDDKVTVTCPATATLAPGQYVDCTASHTITQADLDAGSINNHATAYVGAVTSNQDEETVTAVPNKAISLTKQASPTTYSAVGATISYSYVVTNTGNVTLASPGTISDDKATVSCPTGSLAPGAHLDCTASYTITQADLDAGSVTNHATASMDGATSNQAEATVTATQTPALTIVKSADPATYDAVADTIAYSYLVTNSGNVTLVGPFSVTDDKSTDESCPQPATLAPGAQITCTASYTITQADLDAGTVDNVASAHAVFGASAVDSLTDTETVTAVQNPAIGIEKSVLPISFSAIGDTLSYSYVVTNIGNVTLDGPFTVTDDKTTATCPSDATLAPGAQITCTASYDIVLADVVAELVTNTASAHGYFDAAAVDSDTDDATAYLNAAPALSIDKTSTTVNYDAVGDVVSYSYLLTNAGNTVLSQPFTVTDDKTTVTCPATPATLNPGGTITCTATYTITQADLDAGELTNIAFGTGTYDGNPVDSPTDTVTLPAVANPALSIDKSALETEFNVLGEVLHYSYIVTNIGNVTLNGPFTITDDKSADASCPVTATLAPLATITCTGTYTIGDADLTLGSVTNVASAHGWFGEGDDKVAVDSLTDTVTVVAPPLAGASILDPYCFLNTGVWKMQWVINNPNLRPFTVNTMGIDLDMYPGFIAPPGNSVFTETSLGTHTVTIYYTDPEGQPAMDNLTYTIDSCENVPPPPPPPGQVVPLPIPVTGQGGEIIPVTGADLTPFANIWLFAGFGLFGFGMVLSGLRKRLGL